MTDTNNQVAKFVLDDLKRTLFPLKLSKFTAQYAQTNLHAFIEKINKDQKNFNPQIRVYADKSNRSLRRTLKLDPIAEWYIYYIVYKYRKKIREIKKNRVTTYGYIFKNGHPIPGRESYKNYKTDYYQCLEKFKYSLNLDISNYFNTIYHHDLTRWFEKLDVDQEDVNTFGKFFREINSGRSIDCLPQGMYPCKMIGNSFLNYIDYNGGLRSQRYLRFMDDFILFDNDQSVLYEDFYKIQILLGNKALSINEAKLKLPSEINNHLNLRDIDNVKVQLLNVREQLLQDYDEIENDDENNAVTLEEEQRDFLLDILSNNYVEEEDAELVLLLMRNNWEDVFDKVSNIAFEYPNLAKSSYKFFESVQDHDSVAKIVLQRVKTGEHLTEYQLFWMAKMCEDFLINTNIVGELIHALYEHRSATQISRAKLLEIESSHHGLPELREKVLRDGSSQWLSWCAAIGSKSEIKSHRNQLLQYFQKASSINRIVGDSILNQ